MIILLFAAVIMFARDKTPITHPAAAGGETTSSPVKTLQDDAWGECPAFSHYHEPVAEQEPDGRVWVGDGKCHADIDDSPLGDRKILPNPKDKWL